MAAEPARPYYEQDGITIYHGDCREVLPTLESVDLVLTDPPYGVALQEHGRNGHDMRKSHTWCVVGDDDQSLGQAVIDQCRAQHLPVVAFASAKRPWAGQWRQHLVWDKGPAVGGGGDIATCWKQTGDPTQLSRPSVREAYPAPAVSD
jgi:hypothetical protein